jgi:hypothetical protein
LRGLRWLAIGAAVIGGALLAGGSVQGLVDAGSMNGPLRALQGGFLLALLIFPCMAIAAWEPRFACFRQKVQALFARAARRWRAMRRYSASRG